MKYISIFLFLVFLIQSSYAQKSKQRLIYLRMGESTEILLPEPCTYADAPVGVYKMKKVPGKNNTILLLTPVTDKRGPTNLRIYTKHYDFNIKILMNEPRQETEKLDLRKDIRQDEYFYVAEPDSSEKEFKELKAALARQKKEEKKSLYSFTALQKVRENLLKANTYAKSIKLHSIAMGIDQIFYHKEKIVFKISLHNHSHLPYEIEELKIEYKEYDRKHFFSKKQRNEKLLEAFYTEFHPGKVIAPRNVGHLLFVTEKFGTKNDGKFLITVEEGDGSREIVFEIPAKIN